MAIGAIVEQIAPFGMSGATFAKLWLLILAQHSPDWALSWTAPAECAQGAAVAHSVEQRLGHPVFGEPATYRIEGQVEKLGTGFHALLTLQDAAGTVLGTREVSTADAQCPSLDARVTLVLTLMISPSGALGPGPIAAPPATAPAMLPAPAAPGPLLRQDASVQVHLETDNLNVQLIRRVENNGRGLSFVATTTLCEAPCDKPVNVTAKLFIGGEGIIPSDEFSLEGLSTAATVHVKTGSLPRRLNGVLAMSLGAGMLVGGVALLLVGLIANSFQSQSQPTFTIAGAVLGGVGGAGILTGALLVQGTGTTVTVTQTF